MAGGSIFLIKQKMNSCLPVFIEEPMALSAQREQRTLALCEHILSHFCFHGILLLLTQVIVQFLY